MFQRVTKLLLPSLLIVGLLAGNAAANAATNPSHCFLASQAAGGPAPAGSRPQSPAADFSPQPGQAYIHVSTASNTCGDFTDLDNPALNSKPGRPLLATENVAAYGLEASSLDHPLGVFYDQLPHRWALYNDDQISMTQGRAWNVFIPPQDVTLIWDVSSAGNSSGPLTHINDLQFNGKPSAIIFVQHVYNAYAPAAGAAPQGAPANYFTQTVGVTYDTSVNQWAIRNEDGSDFQFGKSFWVLQASQDETAFTHTVTAGSRLYPYASALDNPLLNSNPDAQILVTQNFDGGVANNHRVGVSYDTVSRRWLILNLDHAGLALGARFNVLVIPPKSGYMVQEATADNTFGNLVYIGPVPFGNPDLNNHPEALVYVTHNWNPPEAPNNMYNDHPIGAEYLNGQWAVANLDGAPMQQGLTFNVYYTWGRGNSFLVSASTTNSSGSAMTLNNPLLNQQPNAIPLISANLNPAGLPGGTYTPTVGLRYDDPLNAWQIFNSGPAFVITQTYNVLIPGPASSFVVTATAPSGNTFEIDNPLTNNNPWALVFASARDNGGLNPRNIGVYYNTDTARWAIFNEHWQDAMPAGAVYDIFVTRLRAYLPTVVK